MGAFLLPIFVSILANVFRSFIPSAHCQDVSPDVVRSEITVEADNVTMTAMQAELESVKKQLSELKTKKKKSKKDDKDKTMIQEAAIALNKLGILKSRANSIVKDLCKDKVYGSSEELLQDAIVYIG
jgi:hypothetical protein